MRSVLVVLVSLLNTCISARSLATSASLDDLNTMRLIASNVQGKLLSGNPFLSSWQATSDPCYNYWTGVSCDASGFITSIDFWNRGTGYCVLNNIGVDISVFSKLSLLSRLTYIDMNNCGLSGSLSGVSVWSNITGLTFLNLGTNYYLSGSIPSSWLYLPRLKELYLDNNLITGVSPPLDKTYNPSNLEYFYLDKNSITLPMPNEWSKFNFPKLELIASGTNTKGFRMDSTISDQWRFYCSRVAPMTGKFYSRSCQGSGRSMTSDSGYSSCSVPLTGFTFTTIPCREGNFTVVGTDTVVKECSPVVFGKFVSSVCSSGAYNITGVDVIQNSCTMIIPTKYFVSSVCFGGSPQVQGYDTTLTACISPSLQTNLTLFSPCMPGTWNSLGSDAVYVSKDLSQWFDGKKLVVCMAGFYCTNPNSMDPCRISKYCPSGSYKETSCSIGYRCPDTSQQIQCNPGQYCPESSVNSTPCADGHYCAYPGLQMKCPQGTYCPIGSIFPQICEGGMLCDGSGRKSQCEPGFFCQPGTEKAVECKLNTYCPQGSSFEIPCPPGYYCNGISAKKCPGGTYSLGESTWCLPCSSSYISSEGSSWCLPCSPGSYCVNNTAIKCQPGFFSDGLQEACRPCLAGFRCESEGTSIPTKCADRFYSMDKATSCLPCPDGKICDNGIQRDCPSGSSCIDGWRTPCFPGSYSDGGLLECKRCNTGTYNPSYGATSSKDCLPCTFSSTYLKTTMTSGASNVSECVCAEGFYQSPVSPDCVECTSELKCSGLNITITEVQPADNYFLVLRSDETIQSIQCRSGSACRNSTCNAGEGFTGFLCASCIASTFYQTLDGSCASCENQSAITEITVVFVLFSLLLTFFIRQKLIYRASILDLRLQRSTITDDKERTFNDNNDPTLAEVVENGTTFSTKSSLDLQQSKEASIVQRLALSHLQVLSIVSRFPFSWPSFIQQMFTITNTVSNVGSSFGIGGGLKCLASDWRLPLPFAGMIFNIGILLFFVVILNIFWVINRCITGEAIKSKLTISLIVLVFLLYSSIVGDFFHLFSCEDVGSGPSRLTHALDVVCYSEDHLFFLWRFIPIGAIIILGLPLYAFVKLLNYKRGDKLMKVSVISTWGFLFDGFKSERWYWEAVILIRKIILSGIGVFLSSSGPNGQYKQGMIALFFFFGAYVLQLGVKPYKAKSNNFIEGFGLAVSIITLILGLSTYVHNDDEIGNLVFQNIITTIIVLMNIAWAVDVFIKLYRGYKVAIRFERFLSWITCNYYRAGNIDHEEDASSRHLDVSTGNDVSLAIVDVGAVELAPFRRKNSSTTSRSTSHSKV